MVKKKEKLGKESVPDSIDHIVSVLRERLSQSWIPPVISCFQQEKKDLAELIKRTVVSSKSNSVVIVGPRGVGKTLLLKSVLNDFYEDKEIAEILLDVHLNGLLQTDDRIALKEIARQLELENTVGDKVFGSFAENLQFLLDALKTGGKHSKPVLFVLDEFDLFTQHKNQTLLYNLFDVAQSAQTPVCVIGLTCRLDIMELLEKRVKSRFSHRQIHLFNKLNFSDYLDVFKKYLLLPATFGDKSLVARWNSAVEKLAADAVVVDVLKRQYNINKDVRGLQNLLIYPVCQLSDQHMQLEAVDFLDSFKILTTDSKALLLHGLSVLELCLIIAMKHLTDLYDGEPFNFEMVYNEYLKFAQQKSSLQKFEKSAVLKAFEHLLAFELVKPMDASSSKVQEEYRPMVLLVHPMQINEVLQKFPACPTEVISVYKKQSKS